MKLLKKLDLCETREERIAVLKGAAGLLCALLLLALCYAGYYEVHFPCYHWRDTEISLKQVNREVPELVISDSDAEMMDAIYELPAVQDSREEIYAADCPELLDAVSSFLGEDIAESVYVWNPGKMSTMYVDWFLEDGTRFILSRYPAFEGKINKTIGICEGDEGATSIYLNTNGESFMRSKRYRLWLGHLCEVWGNDDVSSSGTE